MTFGCGSGTVGPDATGADPTAPSHPSAPPGRLALCESGPWELVSSDALEYEAGRNPRPDRKAYAHDVLGHAQRFVELTPEIEERARAYNQEGLKLLDALHLSCAVAAGADDFCTCDDRFLKRARAIHIGPPKVVNPLELIREIGS